MMLVGELFLFNSQAEVPYPAKDKIVANILLQLPRYTESLVSRSQLCVASDKAFFAVIEELNNQKPVYKNVRFIERGSYEGCDFIYADEALRAQKVLKLKSSALTIASYENFIDEGGAVAVVDSQGRVEIQLNLTAAQKIGITFSPDLIELSKRVIQ
jgi:hypothetical protein